MATKGRMIRGGFHMGEFDKGDWKIEVSFDPRHEEAVTNLPYVAQIFRHGVHGRYNVYFDRRYRDSTPWTMLSVALLEITEGDEIYDVYE